MAATNNGDGVQSLQLIDLKQEKQSDFVTIPKSWLGLRFSADEKYLYASGGNDNWILRYRVEGGKLHINDTFKLGDPWPVKISPTGLDLDDSRQILYVVTKENNSLYLVDLRNGKTLHRYPLPAEGYTCLLSPDKKQLYISCWGCDKLLIFDTQSNQFTASIATGDNPNDICVSGNGRWLFVANCNDNSVSVIDLPARKTVETLNAALFPDAPDGSSTNALALSADNKTLYVANADNNCLAVFDVSKPGESKSKGFIPVGWYPTAVQVVGRKIYVANGKGFSSQANPNGPNPLRRSQRVSHAQGQTDTATRRRPVQYIGSLFVGTLSIISEPDDQQLSKYSREVYRNTPYSKAGEMESAGEPGNPIPRKVGDPSPIKHVFYVLKENRTYDQVLGDLPQGNGDSSLVLFGDHVTPNLHSLAREFVVLDNFYCDGEVSADGHNWSMAAYANDYVEKTWPTSYGGRGGTYDYAGNRAVALPKKGFIWDHCISQGISLRNYGEFADNGAKAPGALAHYTYEAYPGWNLAIQDIYREKIWERDFDSLVRAGKLPQFNLVYLPNDHTSGLSKGAYSPLAAVADNDEAVGRLVEHLSHSPVWKETVIFILEDDAQNGPDHVDAHRSPAYVAGGLVKRHFVDHSMYSTSSMLRTIELILGLSPMSQYDASAPSLWRCFGDSADVRPFQALPPGIDLSLRNTAWNELAKKSAGFDFTREDRVPENAFNEVLWKGIKGMDSQLPASRRAAFVRTRRQSNDRDDD
jgi:WD40 repeat protein